MEIILTTLPNGRITSEGKEFLKLSVHVSLRLTPGQETTLNSFPDIMAWPEKILDGQYRFILGNGTAVDAELISEKIDPELFGAIFHPGIRVKAFEQENLSGKMIHSVPLLHVKDFLMTNYRQAAVESPTRMVTPDKFIDPARFGNISRVKLNEQAIERTQSANLRQPVQLRQIVQADNSSDQQFRTTLQRDKFVRFTPQMNPANDFARLRQFHRLDEKLKPARPMEIKKPDFEFHDILAVASGYPQIMRRFGFILDFMVPVPENVPVNSIITFAYENLTFGENQTKVSTPPTAYQLTSRGFYAADRNESLFRQGFVKINTPGFTVIQVDADGTAIKANNMAEAKTREIARFYQVRSEVMVSRNLQLKPTAEPEPPEEEGLPAMRSAGIGIVRNGMAEHLFNRFDAAVKLQPRLLDLSQASIRTPEIKTTEQQATLRSGAVLRTATPVRNLNIRPVAVPIQLIVPKETLYSDDIVQGYRMDIAYEDAPEKWYSLHQRANRYTWYDEKNTPNEVNENETDEGYIELAVTESADGGDEVFIPETLARWEGWSLSVRRPGYAINEADDDPAPAGQKRDFVNKSKTAELKKYAFDPTLDFKLNVQSKIVPGTLPRLRFGRNYRIRVRTVDLAGNSVPLSHQPESSGDTVRTNIRYMRYEPLASPIVLAGNPLRDGEFLESLVIRSNFDRSAKDYEQAYPTDKTYPDYAQRFLLPPKNSQQMAETHGMFENAFTSNPEAAQTIYNLITSHEGLYKRPEKTEEKIYQPSEVEIIYLPDPMAAGVAFFVSEGYNHSHTQDFKPKMFSFFHNREVTPDQTNDPIPAEWYKAQPLRLRLEEGEPDMRWNGSDRILTVYLPKGFRTRIKYSTFWREEDFKRLSAIWQMITELKNANQSELERTVKSGQHWMISPPREFELVHAVQQPVEIPEIRNIIPERDFNETFVNLHTRFKVHGESTIKAEFQAKWTEPLDDGISVEIDYTRQGRNTVPDVDVSYNDEILTFGTIPEPKLIPAHTQLKGPLKIEAIPVQRFQLRTQTEFEREPQPEARKVNGLYQSQSSGYARMVQSRNTAPKTLVNRVRFDLEENKFSFLKLINLRQKPLIHKFGDTRHRWVDYQLIASSRYREYFEKILKKNAGLSTVRESVWWEKVNILSSARPALPEIDYVIPTFEWRKTNTADAARHRRMGGGLRVYLKRPWFSSGQDEMLAVILPPPPAKGMITMIGQSPSYTDYYTHWAMDPILYSVPPDNPSPGFSDFRMNPVFDENLQYPGVSNARANIAAYPVYFDEKRQQWFCDLAIDPRSMYFPFVRLALARYQPYSVKKEKEDVCLSSVVHSTFIQLVPERQATLVFNREDVNSRFTVTVEGTVYNERIARYGNRSMLRISFIDSRKVQPIYGVVDDGNTEKKLADEGVETYITQRNITNNRYLISMEFRLPREYKTAPFNVIIEEFERGPVKTQGDQIDNAYNDRLQQGEETDRLIYADVFKINQVEK